jgi:hypothetical protein
MAGHTAYQDYPDYFTGVLCPVIHLDTGTGWNAEIGEWEYMLVSDPDGWDRYCVSDCAPAWPAAQSTPWGAAAIEDAKVRRNLWPEETLL